MSGTRDTTAEPQTETVHARPESMTPVPGVLARTPTSILALQRAAGNRAVGAFLTGGAVAANRSPQELEEVQEKIGGTAVRVIREAPVLARDLAIAPTVPNAPAPQLTDAEIDRAVRYNARRFVDPYTVSFVRDVLGVPRYPAVSDRDLAVAAARYQADFGLTPDGRIGPATTARLVAELRAENRPELARLLRLDNMVTWANVNGPAWTGCGNFQWDVNFTTTLREGWLIQRIDNTWNATACGAGGGNVTPAFKIGRASCTSSRPGSSRRASRGSTGCARGRARPRARSWWAECRGWSAARRCRWRRPTRPPSSGR